MNTDRWKILKRLITAGKLDRAEQWAEKMHRVYHAQALPHARVHLYWGWIAALKQEYGRAMKQWCRGIFIAVPVSLLLEFRRIRERV